jgi:polyisoprenyl-teichoic acid--peptidoglycan teichoic acid transferase
VVLGKNASIPKVQDVSGVSVKKLANLSAKRKYRWLGFVGVLGAAIASATAGAMVALSIGTTPFLQSDLSPEEAAVFGQGTDIANGRFRLPSLTRPVNILVIGVKVLSSDVANPPPGTENLSYEALVNSFDGLADTMLLLRFDPKAKTLTLLSLPRDTRTWIPEVGLTKLNAANVYGGPALTARAITNLLGDVPIDRYVRINVQGVEKLIDTLGGVTVYVPYDMYYVDQTQHLYIDLKQGEQHLTGEQALQFLRFRHDEAGDIGRIQRQQTLMQALKEQTLNPVTLARSPQVLSVIQDHLDTNLKVEELFALLGFATKTDRSQVQMLMLPGDFSLPGDFDASYWLPNEQGIQGMVQQYFPPESND